LASYLVEDNNRWRKSINGAVDRLSARTRISTERLKDDPQVFHESSIGRDE